MQEEKTAYKRNAVTKRVSRITILVNTTLAVVKVLSAVLGHSGAMLADAVHSFSDVLGSVAVLIGACIADLPRNKGRAYLQDRIEGGISLVLSLLLFYLAAEIGVGGIREIFSGQYKTEEMPTLLPLAAAIASILVKELLYRFSIAEAHRIDSVALRALAWHNRADAFITTGSLIGISGARLGFPILEPLATVLISFFILRAAAEILMEAAAALRRSSGGR